MTLTMMRKRCALRVLVMDAEKGLRGYFSRAALAAATVFGALPMKI